MKAARWKVRTIMQSDMSGLSGSFVLPAEPHGTGPYARCSAEFGNFSTYLRKIDLAPGDSPCESNSLRQPDRTTGLAC